MSTGEMKITALSPWFGAKRNLAPEIVRELGEHRVYWEPFCGSMAVLLVKPRCVMETVNDLHGDLINLARIIQDPQLGSQLYRRLRRTMMHETLHREAAERHRSRGYLGDRPADLEAAYDYFMSAWLGRNGVAGTQSYNQGFCARYTAQGGHAGTRWSSVIASIPAWRKRLQNVTIMCRDAFAIMEKIADEEGTTIYLDPPYFTKGAKYVHDFTPEDHERLCEMVNRFSRARCVISYYDHPEVDRLYRGWTRRKIDVTKSLQHQCQRGRNTRRATEVLLINGPSYATRQAKLF